MKCPCCGVDMRLYQRNVVSRFECSHHGEVPQYIVETLYAKPNEDLVALIARLEKVVDELERRVHSSASYRTPG